MPRQFELAHRTKLLPRCSPTAEPGNHIDRLDACLLGRSAHCSELVVAIIAQSEQVIGHGLHSFEVVDV
jgi:hypothetical protein